MSEEPLHRARAATRTPRAGAAIAFALLALFAAREAAAQVRPVELASFRAGGAVLERALQAGDTWFVGTCGLPGARSVGHTDIELVDPMGQRVVGEALRGDCAGGRRLSLTAEVPGLYRALVRCVDGGATCGGVVGQAVLPSESAHVRPFVPDQIALVFRFTGGEVLDVGTCGLPSATHKGDTVIQVIGPSGDVVARNDDAEGCGLGSRLTYAVPRAGEYRVATTCFRHSRCGGKLGYAVLSTVPYEQAPTLEGGWYNEHGMRLQLAASARGVLGLEPSGGGAILDARVDYWLHRFFGFAAGGHLGLARGASAEVVGGGAYALAAVNLQVFQYGLGFGVSSLNDRSRLNPGLRVLPVFAMWLGIGSIDDVRLDAHIHLWSVDEEAAVLSVRGALRVPIEDVELGLEGAYGRDGVVFGEAYLRLWPASTLGVRLSAGASWLYGCLDGGSCGRSVDYWGPHVGAGLEWRAL